jgi:hypothetical protein
MQVVIIPDEDDAAKGELPELLVNLGFENVLIQNGDTMYVRQSLWTKMQEPAKPPMDVDAPPPRPEPSVPFPR